MQTLKIAGYEGLKEINLVNNPYILNLDVRYSGIGKISFNNKGCNITNLYASDSLNTLQLSNCGNIKMLSIIPSINRNYNDIKTKLEKYIRLFDYSNEITEICYFKSFFKYFYSFYAFR